MDRLVIVGSLTRWSEDGPMDRIAKAFASNIEAGHAREVNAMALLENDLNAASNERVLGSVR
jgi:hypothetical protein